MCQTFYKFHVRNPYLDKLFWWGSVDNMDDARIPAKRELDKDSKDSAGNAGFQDIPSMNVDDLPFK